MHFLSRMFSVVFYRFVYLRFISMFSFCHFILLKLCFMGFMSSSCFSLFLTVLVNQRLIIFNYAFLTLELYVPKAYFAKSDSDIYFYSTKFSIISIDDSSSKLYLFRWSSKFNFIKTVGIDHLSVLHEIESFKISKITIDIKCVGNNIGLFLRKFFFHFR